MGIQAYNDTLWVPIRSRETCPICGSRKGRCSMLLDNKDGSVIMYRCKYAESSRPSNGWYLHLVKEIKSNNIVTKVKINEYKQTSISEEDLILWDKVYRKLRETFKNLTGSYLYDNHKKNLLDRGYTEQEILRIGFFSVPGNEKIFYNGYSCSLRTAIIKELEKSFSQSDLVKVPGFYKGTYKDKDYVTFKNKIFNNEKKETETLDAYFIPYCNPANLLVGLQYRLTKPLLDEKKKAMRYLWYSSKTVTCGSPIDYYIPDEISLDDVILITEGGIKAKYAASKLKVRSLAEAGVGNYRSLVKNLQKIEKIEGKKYKVLLALDMDKYTNDDVISAEIRTVTLLKSLGYSVTILEWNYSEETKGIDDKILNSGLSGFRYINI